MDLAEVRAFLAVAETGSFAAAAQRLACPRTTLTRRIDALETRVGVLLLHRGRHGAQLTEEGRLMAARAPTLLGDAEALVHAVRSQSAEPLKTLRVVFPVGMPPSMLGVGYQMVRAQFPDVNLRAEFLSASLLPAHAGDFDLLVHFGESALPGDRWVTRPLVWLREWLLATPEYLSQHGTPATIEELADHRLLTWTAPGRAPDSWPALDGSAFEVDPVVAGPDVHTVRQLCASHQGIALLPDGEVEEPEFPPGTFEVVLRDVVGATVPLCLSYPVASQRRAALAPILSMIEMFLSAV